MSASTVQVQWADVPQPRAGTKGVEVQGVRADKAALPVKVACRVERQHCLTPDLQCVCQRGGGGGGVGVGAYGGVLHHGPVIPKEIVALVHGGEVLVHCLEGM